MVVVVVVVVVNDQLLGLGAIEVQVVPPLHHQPVHLRLETSSRVCGVYRDFVI